MARHIVFIPLATIGLLLLADCSGPNSYDRVGVWEPTGANAANLAAMVANPQDLIRGHGSSSTLSKDQVVAVDRIWSGSATSGSGGASAGAAGATGAAGAAPGG